MTTAKRPHVPMITRDLDAVGEWLDALTERAGAEVPLLGTPEWVAASDQVRLASLARWALGQLAELDPAVVSSRLAAEIALRRQAHQQSMRQASVAVSAAHDWRAVAQRRRSGWSR